MSKNKVSIIIAVLAAAMLAACGENSIPAETSAVSESTTLVSDQSETFSEQEMTSVTEAPQNAEMPEPFETGYDDDSRDGFYLPFNSTLNNIPCELMKLRDSEVVDSWLNSFSSSEKTKLNDYPNLYSFMTAFDITKEEAETALAPYIEDSMITSEQLETLFSGSEEAVTSAFASEYSIVVGKNAYCPDWLYSNSVDDYTAAGIDAEAVKEKAPLYSDFAFSEGAGKAFSEKLSDFIGEEIVIEPIKYDESKTTAAEIFDDAMEDVFDDAVDEIAVEDVIEE